MLTASEPARERRVYRGDAIRAIAMPLGGIGTGTIALAGDGSLRQWQIHNQINHMACVPHSFFAIWTRPVRPSGEGVARVLQSAALYDTEGPAAPPTSNDHVVPSAHRRLLAELPGVTRTEFTGEYPIAEVRYIDDALPLTVTMEAFNPFVPLNERDSAIPAILFNLTVTNDADREHLVSIAASLQNAVGWDGIAPITDTRCQLYGGNSNALLRTGTSTTISMSTTRLPDDAPGYGTMALSVQSPEATWTTQWADLRAFWDDFRTDGRLANTADTTPSDIGGTWNGALAVPFRLKPGESRTVPFTIAWHVPNRYVNYSQRGFFNFTDDRSRFWIGNRYATWFRSATDVVSYLDDHRQRLTAGTRLARDTFHDTTLPRPLIEAVTSQMSIVRTPTCFWDEQGHFFGFEGCNGASTAHHAETYGGSCPLNCTHVWNYEMALSRLYPRLERDMRDTEWHIQQHPTGYLPHRVLLPTYLPRTWDQPIGGPLNPALDGLLGAILKTYREYRASGDDAWLDSVWPSVVKALDHVWTAHDPERTGVIVGEQPNTYDISIYGLNTFIGTLYLAALRATEEMARLQGDSALADQCRQVFERGRAALEARLWNGEYYIQDVDLERYPEQNWGQGCHADHLLGQWWAHNLGLGHVLDPERVRSAAHAIVRHNFRERFRDVTQKERKFASDDDAGLLICTWPRGGRPEVPTRYSDEVWTGLEYEVAGLLLWEGQVEEALRIVEAVRARYDGTKQNPWNDIECGDHYVRAMSSWALLEAASGFGYDAATASITFAPVIDPDDYRAPFVARDGWGTFRQRRDAGAQEVSLEIAWGHLVLKRLRLAPGDTERPATATLAGDELAVTTSRDGDRVAVDVSVPVTVSAGQTLTVQI